MDEKRIYENGIDKGISICQEIYTKTIVSMVVGIVIIFGIFLFLPQYEKAFAPVVVIFSIIWLMFVPNTLISQYKNTR